MPHDLSYIDISPPISPLLAVWPGDVPFGRSVAMDIQTGDHLTLSSISTTLHVGAHADAPSHFAADGKEDSSDGKKASPDSPGHRAIDRLDLTPYMGPCLVLDLAINRGELITPVHLARFPILSKHPSRRASDDTLKDSDRAISRLLCKTGSYPDLHSFNEDFVAFHPEAIAFLGELGVILVGIDTPSVDPFDSKDLLSHHQLLRFGMRNLEGLDLSKAREGVYELIALPLRLVGCDASPVRAILRSWERRV